MSFPLPSSFGLLLHIYYPDSYTYLLEKLSHLEDKSVNMLVNICLDTPAKTTIIEEIRKKFPSANIISTANIGKDIGAKLAMYYLLNHLGISSDWLLFLHDKQSPQAIHGSKWRDDLYRIFDKDNLKEIAGLMQNSSCGMIGNKENLVEYSKESDPNSSLFERLAKSLELSCTGFQFIGGTTFWIRKNILDRFLQEKSLIEIRFELEKGNVMDHFEPKYTHSWERIFGCMVENAGYSIKVI